MAQLTQLVYVSRSTSKLKNFTGAVEPNAGKILIKSRVNNRISGLTGVLCFADGCFFQCLEGEEISINNLLLKLKKDTEHSDVTVIWRKPIKTRSFERWEMKYVAVEGPMMKWLELQGYKRFDPYQFDDLMVEKVLNFLGGAVARVVSGVES